MAETLEQPTGSWSVAAAGDYGGHHWIRYVTPSTHGVCLAVDIDGKADLLFFAKLPPGVPLLPPAAASEGSYQGHVAACDRLTSAFANGTVVTGVPITIDVSHVATSTEFGYLSGIAAKGVRLVASFSDGTHETVGIAHNTFTLFYPPAKTLTILATMDDGGTPQAQCRVGVFAPSGTLKELMTDC